MSARDISSSKMALRVDEIKRSTPTKTNCTTSHGRWAETAVATLNVIMQILVFKLRKWTRFMRNEINGYPDGLVLALNKSIEKSVNATRVVYRTLGVVIGELFNTINELFGADLIAATSDVVGNLVTGSSYVAKIVRTLKAAVIVRIEASDRSTAPADNDCDEQLEKIQLPLKDDLVQQNSNVRPNMSERKNKYKSILINKRTVTKCEEKPGKCEKIITNTPQPGVLKIEGLMYEDLTPNAGPVASCRLDKMAQWRREKFFVDNKATVTPGTAEGLDSTVRERDASSANRDRTTEGRDASSSGQYRTTEERDASSTEEYGTTERRGTSSAGQHKTTERRDTASTGKYRTTAARHLHSRGSAPKPRPQKDTTCRRPVPDNSVPLTTVPPPPGPGHFWHGNLGPFVGPPLPDPRYLSSHGPLGPFAGPPPSGPEHLSHGPPGQFVVPPLPGPRYLPSHGPLGPFMGPPPSGSGHLSHGPPGRFVGPPPPGPGHLSHGSPGPFVGSPFPTTGHFRNARPEPFPEPPLPTSGHSRRTRPELLTGPSLPTSRRFQYSHPGPFVGPPIRSGFTANTAPYGVQSTMVNAHGTGQGPYGPLSTFARDPRRH